MNAVDGLHLRPDLPAEKGGRREIEGELLDSRIELHLTPARPLCDPRRDAGIEFFEVRLHRSGLEGNRERAAMQAVLVEIAQHQSAGKQTIEDRPHPNVEEKFFCGSSSISSLALGPSNATLVSPKTRVRCTRP